MPIPRRAIEVGSGMTLGLTVTSLKTLLEVPEKEKPVKANPEAVLGVTTEIVKVPEVAALKVIPTELAGSVDGGGPGNAIPLVKTDTPVKVPDTVGMPTIGSTVGAKVIWKSLTVPVIAVKVTDVVTVWFAAWLGVANATLASKPAATVKKSDRFVIEIS
jgi:hypothetical protein